MKYSSDIVHSGKRSLRIDLRKVRPDRSLLVHQRFGRELLEPYDGRRVRLSAWMWIAAGPQVFQGTMNMRQWADPGTPPFGNGIGATRIGGSRGEWLYAENEFLLALGPTRRADVTVGFRAPPATTSAPVCYLDDFRLEVLPRRPLTAERLRGRVLFAPAKGLPVCVRVSDDAWQKGRRYLRWDITTADGLHSLRSREVELRSPVSIVEPEWAKLVADEYAVRLALGARSGERLAETLIPFRWAEGPYAQ